MSVLTITIPHEILERLEAIAHERGKPLEGVVQSALIYYIEQEQAQDSDPEPTSEEILQMIEQSQQEIREGRAKTIEQVLAEIRAELGG